MSPITVNKTDNTNFNDSFFLENKTSILRHDAEFLVWM